MCVCGGGGGDHRIVWLLMVGLFNICTDVNACDCTQLLHKHYQKVCTQGEKKPPEELNLYQQHPRPSNNQLSYKNSDIYRFYVVDVAGYLVTKEFCFSANVLLMFSAQGTVIRVFGLPDAAKLYEFRRGVKR